MSGNYGGNSLATTPIDGATLLAARGGIYKDWKCNSIYSVGTSAAFTYMGEAFTLPVIGNRVDLLITPGKLSAAHAHAMFLCYECSCNSPMTGSTVSSPVPGATIIGGGGLNS